MLKVVRKPKTRSVFLSYFRDLKLGEQKNFLDTDDTCGHRLCEVYGTCEDCCQCGYNNCGIGRNYIITKMKKETQRKVNNLEIGNIIQFFNEYRERINDYKMMDERNEI